MKRLISLKPIFKSSKNPKILYNFLKLPIQFHFSSDKKGNKQTDLEYDLKKKLLFSYDSPSDFKIAPITTPTPKINEKSQQDHTNLNVLKRELKNDAIQLPLKFYAFYTAPPNTIGPYWAEFIRSSIDCMNHIVLLMINFVKTDPSKTFPYGMEKIKNIVVLIPAILFVSFGAKIIFDSISDLYYLKSAVSGHEIFEFSQYKSIMIYLISIFVETNVIFKNLVDASNQTDKESQKLGFLQKLQNFLNEKRKDPLLLAVLFENLITFTSTCIPLLASVINMYFPSDLIEYVASGVIASIQIFLGYELFKRNIPNLLGKGVDVEIVNDIVNIIQANSYVIDVKDPKGVMTGIHKFRFSANVTYNEKRIKEELISDVEETLDRITFERDYDDRSEELSDLIGNMPRTILREIQMQQAQIEQAIATKYSDCKDIHLEIDYEEDPHEEEDEVDIKDHLNVETELKKISFLDEAADNIIKSDFMIPENKKNIKRTEQTYPFLKTSEFKKKFDFIDSQIDHYYIDQNIYCNEDYRFEILKQNLENSERLEDFIDMDEEEIQKDNLN